ncbi:MAG: glycosyltransferase family 4 protein [Chitinophagaceae bacterium]
MKIGFVVVNEYPQIVPTGGIGVFVKSIAEGFCNQGIQAEVLLITNKKIEDAFLNINQVKIHILPMPQKKGIVGLFENKFKIIKQIEKVVKENNISILEISTSDSFLIRPLKGVDIIARTHGSLSYAIKNHYTPQGFLSTKFQLRHENNLLKQAKKIICISHQYLKHYQNHKSKTILVENFIAKEYDSISDLAKNAEKPYLFFHGSLKNIKGVVELAYSFKKSKAFENYNLYMAGKGSEQIKKELKDILQDRLTLLGELNPEGLKQYLSRASLCVYPSKRDAFNLAVAEAMSQKGLVLVSEAIDEHIVSHMTNGIRFPLKDLDSFEQHIDFALQLDEAKKTRIKTEAMHHVRKNFTFDIGLQKNIQFYNSISAQ